MEFTLRKRGVNYNGQYRVDEEERPKVYMLYGHVHSIYRKDGNGKYKYIGKVTKGNLSFTDKSTKNGVTYIY